MADQEYERDEKLLEARRLRRLELKRKRMIRQRITLGVVFVVIVVLIVVLFRACGGSEDTPPADNTDVTDPASPTEPETPSGDTATATLAAVGDIMVYDSQLADALEADGTYNFLPMLSPVSSYLTAADVTVGNFEANFGDDPVGYPDFRAPASLATTLSGLGFDILQTANTYSIQNGITGLQSTVNTIRGAGMDALGTYLSADDKTANQVIVREVNGIRMAFIGFTKGVNNLTLPEGSEYAVDLLYTDYATNYSTVNTSAISAAVAAAQATEPDVIIAMVHWGSEYETSVSATQTQIKDLLIQSGVDVILGSHPHIVGPMKMETVTVDGQEKQVFVAYSLGNFLAAMTREDQTYLNEGVVLNLTFTKSGGETTISHVDYVPTFRFDNGESAVNRYEVRAVHDVLANEPDEATAAEMEQVLSHLQSNTGSDYDIGTSVPAAGSAAAGSSTTDAGETEATQ